MDAGEDHRYGPGTALVVVDVQNDFADPKGSLHVPHGEEVIPVVNDEVHRARAAGSLVVYSQDWHPEHTPHFDVDGGIWPVHCVHDTWGAQLSPELVVDGPVVRKGVTGGDGYSAFTEREPGGGPGRPTQLASLLRAAGVRRLVVLGLATDYCVKQTVLDALRMGYDVDVVSSGVRAVDIEAGDGERALGEMAGAGAHLV